MSTHHQYECKLSLFFEETQLNRLPLAMMAFRAVTQKPLDVFLKEHAEGKFDQHNVQNGVINAKEDSEQIFYSDDYANLFNLVTHSERRDLLDVVTKYVFSGILIRCLEAAGYFDRKDSDKEIDPDAEQKNNARLQPSKEHRVIG